MVELARGRLAQRGREGVAPRLGLPSAVDRHRVILARHRHRLEDRYGNDTPGDGQQDQRAIHGDGGTAHGHLFHGGYAIRG
ncbi:hypothetical protein DB31_3205 [Hyalangium minutum]|uniref:Uncharacterized protein n=1 Tax=Hyalangium minutum TaxID=394096 RepID=A0A085WTR2_9BACT|nr:hypothetical protein DB31_3205 [Hyalangium minutum]